MLFRQITTFVVVPTFATVAVHVARQLVEQAPRSGVCSPPATPYTRRCPPRLHRRSGRFPPNEAPGRDSRQSGAWRGPHALLVSLRSRVPPSRGRAAISPGGPHPSAGADTAIRCVFRHEGAGGGGGGGGGVGGGGGGGSGGEGGGGVGGGGGGGGAGGGGGGGLTLERWCAGPSDGPRGLWPPADPPLSHSCRQGLRQEFSVPLRAPPRVRGHVKAVDGDRTHRRS